MSKEEEPGNLFDAMPTNQFAEIDGIVCRVWNGMTKSGVVFKMLVYRVAHIQTKKRTELQAELALTGKPHFIKMPDTAQAPSNAARQRRFRSMRR